MNPWLALILGVLVGIALSYTICYSTFEKKLRDEIYNLKSKFSEQQQQWITEHQHEYDQKMAEVLSLQKELETERSKLAFQKKQLENERQSWKIEKESLIQESSSIKNKLVSDALVLVLQAIRAKHILDLPPQ